MKKLSLFLVVLTMLLVSCKPEIEKPTVVTKSVSEVTKTTAKVVGQVAADGGAEVTERGICWSTDGTPTILDYRVKDTEGGLGTFTLQLSDLESQTTYYVRAYATNEAGTSYGEEKSFVAGEDNEPGNGDGDENEEPEQPIGPTVTTSEVTDITFFSAKFGGEVISAADAAVIRYGVCYSTNPTPDITASCEFISNGIGGVFDMTIYGLEHSTTYYVRAFATDVKNVTAYGEEVSFTTLDKYNGHKYVDLGLSVKWASYNVGATSPEDYGHYFAWGETSPKEEYTEDNCPTYRPSSELQSQGYIDENGNLTPQYDAATANWGGVWRMPTYVECNELLNNCTWEWTTHNGVKGYKVTGPNGNSIFLPAAGSCCGSSINYLAGSYGEYWNSYGPYESSHPDGNTYYLAYGFDFNSDRHSMDTDHLYYGKSVRPVGE